jgi:hypothetical protein
MTRRNIIASLLCTATIAAAGFAAYTSLAFGQPAEKGRMSAMTNDQHEQCIKVSAACAVACGRASEHCLTLAKDGKGEHAAMAALSADCGDCCASCLAFVSRSSQLSPAMCECCDQCAAACDMVDGQAMKDCAKACRECAAACRAMGK